MGKEFDKFLEDIDAECTNVKATGDEIRKIVEARVAQLIDEINAVKSETRKTFETQKEKLELTLIGLESFGTYCSELKIKGKLCDITRASSDLLNRATELLQTDIVPFKNYVAPSVVFIQADVSTISDLVGDVRTDTYSATRVIRESLDADKQENFKFATVLDGAIYSLMETKEGEMIRVYDGATYDVTREIPVPGLVCSIGLIACKQNHCLYIADQCEKDDESASSGAGEDSSTEANNNDNENNDEITSMKGCVHRVQVKGKMTKWLIECRLFDFSVTPQFTVLITYCEMAKLIEYTTHGKQLIEIYLETVVVYPSHAIQLSNGQFVVSHGMDEDNPLHRVCIVDSNGNVKLSYGAAQGSASVGLLNCPCSLAVDKNEFIYVADCENKRVLLLSPTLEYVRDVYRSTLVEPCQLYLDIDGRRLFITTIGIMTPVMILSLLY